MVIKEEGHIYELQNFESETTQTLTFVKKAPVSPESEELETVIEGTTNEEVLSALINRLGVLNAKFPSRENSIVITKLEESLMWLNKRTEDRKARGVEGKHIK
jgi:hypothetical protein